MANPLKKRREELAVSQAEIAERFNPRMSQTAVCAWENGGSAFARKLIPQVATAYGITEQRATEIRRYLIDLRKRTTAAA